MADLIKSPYNLQYDTLILAVVKSRNSIGWSNNYSTANTIGARV